MKPTLVISVILLILPALFFGGVYATWEGLELDKYASIWLIKRYVDTEAKFAFSSAGEEIVEGTIFDTPFGKWKRVGNHTTFDTILEEINLQDESLIRLGCLIREIEISRWARPPSENALLLEETFFQAVKKAGDNSARVTCALEFFDQWYEQQAKEKPE